MRLQGIGEFTLDNFYENPFENEKGRIKVPENAIRFAYDKKSPEDTGLIDFISQQTKKIKPLASSDLEDYLNIGRQLLNVSKQFYIEGLGTLLLNDQGGLDFVQGNEIFAPLSLEESRLPKQKLDENAGEMNFEEYSPKSSSSGNIKKFLVITATAAGLFVLGWIGWYFFQQWQNGKNGKKEVTPENIQPVFSAGNPADAARNDSAITHTDSLHGAAGTHADNAASRQYDVIIETSRRARALSRYDSLRKWGYNVGLKTDDSVTFSIYTTISGQMADSTRVLDSISRFFGRKARIKPE
jgi:hypothetical protein